MSEVVLTAIITGLFSVLSAFIAASAASRKTLNEMKISQAVTDTKIDSLKEEVREHNNFAKRLPAIEEQIRGLDGRIKNLERKAG